ncbi:MAG: hypothetical protein ACRCSG_08300 [Cellulosilyticaceae bacterium]
MKKSQKGSVLGGVLVVFVTVFVLGTGLLQLTTASHRQSINAVDKKQATYMAESGLEIILNYLRSGEGDVGAILPNDTNKIFTSSPIILEDASEGEWNVTIDIENIVGDADTYKITSTGMNTKKDIEEKVSAIIKGKKNQNAILGGTTAHNIDIHNSFVEIKNGSIICREDVGMDASSAPTTFELENLITLGNYTIKNSASLLKANKAYIAENVNVTNSRGLDINRMEVGGDLNIKGTQPAAVHQGPSIDSAITIGKLFTGGITSITGTLSNEGSIKLGLVESVGEVELGSIGKGNGNGNGENQAPVEASKIVAGADVTLNTYWGILNRQKIDKIVKKAETEINYGHENEKTVTTVVDSDVPVERENSWVCNAEEDGEWVEHKFTSPKVESVWMPKWVSKVFSQAEKSANALKEKVKDSNLPILKEVQNTGTFHFGAKSAVGPNEKYVNGDDIPKDKLVDELWVEEKGALYVTRPNMNITLQNAIIPEGESWPINIYNPEGTVEIKNCSGTFEGQIVAKQIKIINSGSETGNKKEGALILDLGGGENNGNSPYTGFEIIKYEK